ncbi:GNAT family N-acetyltransferase [Euzebya rosea]|uniref:GNAT family N-acetyltransferase n=1 Tax=Euzebya rosea TaxID=2052804 RepID=UPI000D3E5239|nr:GNAT family N-acetyltransferase [Euzebya rosea]
MTGIRLREVVAPAPPAEWSAVAATDPHTLVSQTPAASRAAARSWGAADGSRLYTFADGTRAVLPGVRIGVGSAARLASQPGAWGFGGLIADQPLRPSHVAAVLDDLRRRGPAQVHLRPNPLDAAVWHDAGRGAPVVRPASAGVLDLRGGWDRVQDEGFSKSTRRLVRRAQREGIEVRCSRTDGDIDAFLQLLAMSVTRWARRDGEIPAVAHLRKRIRDPRRRLRRLRDAIGPSFRLYLALLDGHPISGALVLQGGNAHYTRGAMDIDAVGQTGATHLLQATAIRAAAEAGCAHYHMGDSAPGSGLESYKQRFGAVPVPYASYRLERLPFTRWETVARGTARAVLVRTPAPDGAVSEAGARA